MSWGYGSDDGPDKWNKSFPIADGNRQSPIDIPTSQAGYDENLKSTPLKMTYNEEKELAIINTGHSVSAKIKEVSELSGGPLKNKFRLEQFHLHWGSNDDKGSEHTIDGSQYPSELHLVHWNCEKYGSFVDAVDKPDGLSVVGVMIKIGEEHAGFKVLSDNVTNVKESGSNFSVKSAFNPKCLLPENTQNYWTYLGSLTTPPLFESVEWIVLQNPIEVSKEQIESLRSLKFESGTTMQDNFRPPCPMKDRKLRKSFQ